MSERNAARFNSIPNAQARTPEEQHQLMDQFEKEETARYEASTDEAGFDEAMAEREYEVNAATEGRILENPQANRMYMMAQHIAELRANGGEKEIIKAKEDKLAELLDAHTTDAYATRDAQMRAAEMERDTLKGREIRVGKEIAAEEELEDRLAEAEFLINSTDEEWVKEKLSPRRKEDTTASTLEEDLDSLADLSDSKTDGEDDEGLPEINTDPLDEGKDDDDGDPPVPVRRVRNLDGIDDDGYDKDHDYLNFTKYPNGVDDSGLPRLNTDPLSKRERGDGTGLPVLNTDPFVKGATPEMTPARPETKEKRSWFRRAAMGAAVIGAVVVGAALASKGMENPFKGMNISTWFDMWTSNADAANQPEVASTAASNFDGYIDVVDGNPIADTLPPSTGFEYPWNWAEKAVGGDQAMGFLEGLANKAEAAGHAVEWHGDGTTKWVEVDGNSNTQHVVDVLRQFNK